MPTDLDKFFNSKTGHTLLENIRYIKIQLTRLADAQEHQNILTSKLLSMFKEAVNEPVNDTVPEVESL
jgi:hypothetical protein